MGKLAAASQAVQDAGAREAAAARALLAKDVEISNLKGEVGSQLVSITAGIQCGSSGLPVPNLPARTRVFGFYWFLRHWVC